MLPTPVPDDRSTLEISFSSETSMSMKNSGEGGWGFPSLMTRAIDLRKCSVSSDSALRPILRPCDLPQEAVQELEDLVAKVNSNQTRYLR